MADKPWIFRTYAGHSTAKDSNALYKTNLAKGTDRPFGGIRSAHADRL
jgi:methylmalonyl-CoA mutase N-terminal domain/subunit